MCKIIDNVNSTIGLSTDDVGAGLAKSDTVTTKGSVQKWAPTPASKNNWPCRYQFGQ